MNCRLCGASAGQDCFGAYLRCRSCGGMCLESYPDVQPNHVFAGHAVRSLEVGDLARRAYYRRRLSYLGRHLDRPPRDALLLEIGCGAGVLLEEAAVLGWRTAAVEMSPELASLAQRRNPSAAIVIGDVLTVPALPGEGEVDAVIALDVLEHVLDAAAMLERCRRYLRPGGIIVLQTPNARSLRARTQGAQWPMLDAAQHLQLFPAGALTQMLAKAGFDVLACRTVSGSGVETGAARVVAFAKESLLAACGLGNALLVVARAR